MHAFYEMREENVRIFTAEDFSFPLHLHAGLEMYLVLQGSALVQVGTQARRMKAGELAIMFPNQIHSYQSTGEDSRAALLICDLKHTGGYMDTLLSSHPLEPFLTPEALHRDVSYAMKTLMEEAPLYSAACTPLIQLILCRVLPKLQLVPNRRGEKPELTYEIVQYVGQHFQEKMTLDGLASVLGISKYHLSRTFSEKMRGSFTDYVTDMRLSYACGKLRDTLLPVTDIAMDAGFESQRTFFRAFRQRYDMTPLQYRHAARFG